MRKQGPCFHCGIAKTPLWRNGPPEKPVLCNACGSRYRLGKSLENYIPKCFHVRNTKRKAAPNAIVADMFTSDACCSSVLENYASSESSTSHNFQNSSLPVKQVESSGRFWEFPSRKRSRVVYRRLNTIQKLQMELHNILRSDHENSFRSASVGSEDDVLIYNIDINKMQLPPTEIGLGGILLNFPVTSDQEQQEIEPCSSGISGSVSCLNHAESASPSLANDCSEDVEYSPLIYQEDDGAPPTMESLGIK